MEECSYFTLLLYTIYLYKPIESKRKKDQKRKSINSMCIFTVPEELTVLYRQHHMARAMFIAAQKETSVTSQL